MRAKMASHRPSVSTSALVLLSNLTQLAISHVMLDEDDDDDDFELGITISR